MSKKLALMLLLYALGNTKVNKTLSLPTGIFSSRRGNKMYTNGHVGGGGGGHCDMSDRRYKVPSDGRRSRCFHLGRNQDCCMQVVRWELPL